MNFRMHPVRWPPNTGNGRVCWSIFLILSLLLSGCAAPAPKVTSGQAVEMPPVVTTTDQAKLPAPPQTQLPSEQKTAPPAGQDLSREPLAGPSGEVIFGEKDGTPAARHIGYIEQRLAVYEKKFQQWLDLRPQEEADSPPWSSLAPDSCLDKFDTLLSGYTDLRDRLRSGRLTSEEDDIQKMLQLDIAFLESDCAKSLAPAAQAAASTGVSDGDPVTAAAQAEQLINQYSSEEDYEQVIAVYQLLTKTYPTVTPSLLCTKQYGLARLYTGDIEEAADVFRQTLTVFDAKNHNLEPWALQRLTADLLLAEGRPAEARTMYEKLLASSQSFNNDYTWATRQLALIDTLHVTDPQMTYYLDLLRAVLVFNRKDHSPLDLLAKADKIIQTFPNTPVADNAMQIRKDIENQLREWIDTVLAQVDELVAKKEFQPALALLAKMSAVHLPANLREQVQLATDGVKTAQRQEEEAQRLQHEQSLAMQWKSSNDFLDSQRYDSAIAGFAPLLDTPYDAEARQKIQEATNLAAAAQRKQAATLFIRAIKATTPEDKKELLLESRQLLQDVLLKYPDADIIDKVAQNLTTLEQHIQQFDPTLLEKTDENDMKEDPVQLKN
jgi:BMFP domain-containing protein YqiC